MNAIINYLDKYSEHIIMIQLGLTFILVAIIISVYFYNRKKYHNLKHQIPASVVKNYLDSIIQNSTSLKSSLFRGGGLDVDTTGVPSIFPVGQMDGDSMNLATGAGEEQLKAQVAKLEMALSDKSKIIIELEGHNSQLSGDVKSKDERIIELEGLLSAQGKVDTSADGAESGEKISALMTENERLKNELAQYEMIEDDLADLKRLKQENEQLKSALGTSDDLGDDLEGDSDDELDSAADEMVAELDSSEVSENLEPEVEAEIPIEEEVAETESVEAEVTPEPASEEPEPIEAASASEDDEDNSKSPEDLLSEFEKMLG